MWTDRNAESHLAQPEKQLLPGPAAIFTDENEEAVPDTVLVLPKKTLM